MTIDTAQMTSGPIAARPARGRGFSAAWAARFGPTAVAVVVLTLFVSLPLYSMVVTAFKTDKEIYDDFTYIPRQPTLAQFERVIVRERIFINIRNSLIVATTATVISVSMSTLAAFAVVRLRFRDGSGWPG